MDSTIFELGKHKGHIFKTVSQDDKYCNRLVNMYINYLKTHFFGGDIKHIKNVELFLKYIKKYPEINTVIKPTINNPTIIKYDNNNEYPFVDIMLNSLENILEYLININDNKYETNINDIGLYYVDIIDKINNNIYDMCDICIELYRVKELHEKFVDENLICNYNWKTYIEELTKLRTITLHKTCNNACLISKLEKTNMFEGVKIGTQILFSDKKSSMYLKKSLEDKHIPYDICSITTYITKDFNNELTHEELNIIKYKINNLKQLDVRNFSKKGNMEIDDILLLLKNQKMRCYICNEVVLIKTRKYCCYQFSIDRIDDKLPHNKNNILISCYYCNCRNHIKFDQKSKICKSGCHIVGKNLPTKEEKYLLDENFMENIAKKYNNYYK
jgi:hypothetical protein